MPPKRAKPGFFGRHDKILLYVPNLIGAPSTWRAQILASGSARVRNTT